MENKYYARSPNENGEWETVDHHLSRTAQLCQSFLDPLGLGDWGWSLGAMHDFGKISAAFQEVLSGKRQHVNHAAPGAAMLCSLAKSSDDKEIISGVAASHHSELKLANISVLSAMLSGKGERRDEDGKEYSLFGEDEFRAAIPEWQSYNLMRGVPHSLPVSNDNDSHIYKMLLARMLYSGLVDADYCSAAEHFDPHFMERAIGTALNAGEALKQLLLIQEGKRKSSKADPRLNDLRDALFYDCLVSAGRKPGIFTLTAPTGLGKTLSLMAFALKHAEENHLRRVIIALPYLSIIEQNVRDYQKIIPDLLESYSTADVNEECRFLSQRWDAPCILTTNIGLFEPLFSNRPSQCRHLHQIAKSVIVLDEAQSLPPDLLEATLQTVKILCRDYGCSVVFSTATQPSYNFLPDIQWTQREIASDPQAMFNATRRVKYEWRIDTPVDFADIAHEAASEKQCIIIVNLRSHARTLYRALCEETNPEEVFFLTTDLCPAHRLELIDEVRSRLAGGEPCRLVSTQCIESGVDLSCPVLFRALAPLDSIIQAAGRCNRNGISPDGRVIVFVPNDKRLYPSGGLYEVGANCVKTLLSRHPIDCSNLNHIEEYWELLYSCYEGDKTDLTNGINHEDFTEVNNAYRMIENSGVDIIVPYSGENELYDSVKVQYDSEGLSNALLKRARMITVSTYDRTWVQENCIPLLYANPEQREMKNTQHYMLCRGNLYHDKLGLVTDTNNNYEIL